MSDAQVDVHAEYSMRVEIKTLIKKAADSTDSGDAMRFSQAACNAANAMACLDTIRRLSKE